MALKRELWAKLLTTALGTSFADEDSLFVEHTLLVVTAELIGHAVAGFDPTDSSYSPASLLGGQLFTSDAQILGVVEEDFFDWIIEVDGGAAFVRTLARRLSRFVWDDVEHDVMKVLYESVIAPDTRHRLGEYYTPDWLAAAVVDEAVTDPLTQRVLDPACGSGTFVFHAVRAYLAAAETADLGLAETITGLTQSVMGLDVHPVAVTLARITYLLAIGRDRLRDDDRPPFAVPIYLGDSVQWGQDDTLVNTDALIVHTNDGSQLFADELRFPDRVVVNAGTFDALVSELADKATAADRPSRLSLTEVFRRYAVHPDDQPIITATFKVLCELHDQGRNHIWAYYVRNLARPLWLARPENQVEVIVGNPPWLSYRFMPPGMKTDFAAMSRDRDFWAGAAVATHQDLSALFVARATELYLKPGGTVAMVMPHAVFSRRQFAGFRTGKWGTPGGQLNAAFTGAWDLHRVKPSFFPVPGCVVLATRAEQAHPLSGPSEDWSGRTTSGVTTAAALAQLTRVSTTAVPTAKSTTSPYAQRFSQGATLVPRFMIFVEPDATSPLGAGAGRRAVRSIRSPNEKKPWKTMASLHGTVEKQFIRPALVGDSLLPFLIRRAPLAIIPWDGSDPQKTVGERLDRYPGLSAWWTKASTLWEQHKAAGSKLSLLDRLDYQRGLGSQFPAQDIRVVYSKSGMYLAAAVVTDAQAVIDQQLYWATAASLDEAHYLCAVLNSSTLLRIVQPLQARGEHNPRHFDKVIWQAPIPLYDESHELHQRLVSYGRKAAEIAAAVELPQQSFQALRRRVRTALADDEQLRGWEDDVAALIAGSVP